MLINFNYKHQLHYPQMRMSASPLELYNLPLTSLPWYHVLDELSSNRYCMDSVVLWLMECFFYQIAGPSVYLVVASTFDSPFSLFSLTLTVHTYPWDFTQLSNYRVAKLGLYSELGFSSKHWGWLDFSFQMTAFFTSAITLGHFSYHSCVQWSTTSIASKNPAFAFTSLLFPQEA